MAQLLLPGEGVTWRMKSQNLRHRRTLDMTLKAKDRIEAEVVLRPRRPVAAKAPVRAKSLDQFEAAPKTVEKLIRKLNELGFQVLAVSPTSISIAGTRAAFERVFKLTDGPDSSPPDLTVPRDLEDYVEG